MLLLGWLLATGHVVTEHGGERGQPGHHEIAVSHDHDDHHDAPARDTHRHDLMATAAQSASLTAQIAAMSAWVPLHDSLIERLTAMLREAEGPQLGIEHGDAPLDERSSGWLLVCRTSQQVRGPSFAV
jgi:hypothetical protein